MRSFVLGIAMVSLVGCVADADVANEDTDTTNLNAATIRPAIKGELDRDFSPPVAPSMPFVNENVVQLGWDELEASGSGTTSGGFYPPHTHGWLAIENAYGATPVRIRILAGSHAPAYAKRIGFGGIYNGGGTTGKCTDGGVYLYDPHDNVGGCAPKFWTPAYLARYRALMTELASRYGTVGRVYEIVNSACMTTYAEPFYRAHGDKDSNQRLLDAGLTWSKDVYCHQQAILMHASLFPAIRTSLAVNGWDEMDPSLTDRVRTRFNETFDFLEGGGSIPYVVDATGKATSTPWAGARHLLGLRLVLQNNGLGENEGCTRSGGDTLANAQVDTYCYLSYTARTTSGSVGFQTETMDRLREKQPDGSYIYSAHDAVRMTLDNALAMHANFVELPGGYQKLTAQSDLQMLSAKDSALEANAP